MKKIFTFLIFLVLAIDAATGWLTTAAAQPQPIIIGAPLPLSGNFIEFGIMMQNSMEMAKAAVNQAGGIHGRPIEIRYSDDRGEAAGVRTVFANLMRGSEPVMLVGGYASDPTYEMAKIAEAKPIPFLICTASADKITQRGWRNIYRLNPPISEYTQGLEDFWIKNFKPRTMAIINENSMFGTNGAMRMIEFCRNRAIEISAHLPYDRSIATTPAYFRSLLATLTIEPPDVIYMISYLNDAVLLVKEIRALNLKSLLCGGAGGFTLEEFTQRAGEASNYLVTAALWSEHVLYQGAKAYYTEYKARYGQAPDYHGAEAYSAVLVGAEALKRAESFNPQDIRKALDQIYMKTPFGPVKFYSYEDFERQNSLSTLVLQVINGKFETIWPPNLASAKFVRP
jgi:branched-chain amino acid transport system substrate-binding protein